MGVQGVGLYHTGPKGGGRLEATQSLAIQDLDFDPTTRPSFAVLAIDLRDKQQDSRL